MSLRVASFVSGGGTTMREAFRVAQNGEIPGIEPALVVASKPGIWAIEKATKTGTEGCILSPVPVEILKNTRDPAEILTILYRYGIQVIFQNGYLPLMPSEVVRIFSGNFLNSESYESHDEYRKFMTFFNSLPLEVRRWAIVLDESWLGAIFNQHPGIVRADHVDFGGKGMFWSRVTAALVSYLLATDAGVKECYTESTVQYTHAELDKWVLLGARRLDISNEIGALRESLPKNGLPILVSSVHGAHIAQRIIDTTEQIQKILLPLEHENVIELLQKLGRGEKPVEDPVYRQNLIPRDKVETLQRSKSLARRLFPKG